MLTAGVKHLPDSIDELLRRAGNVGDELCEGTASELRADMLLARPELTNNDKHNSDQSISRLVI